MRDVLTMSRRRIRVGWLLPLVLLALPTCGLDSSGINCCEGDGDGTNPPAFEPGTDPTTAVMCYIPQVTGDSPTLELPCADPVNDIPIGMPDSQAAIALYTGDGNSIVIDYSTTSFSQCGDGNPRRIDLFDNFPQGTTVCVNCTQQIGSGKKYADAATACVAKCEELIGATTGLSLSQITDFCQTNARLAPNFEKNACYDNVCSTGGTPLGSFADPRINPENLTWVDVSANATANGNTLTFPGPGDGVTFDGGAASDQIIQSGDAWVEFEAGELNVTHVIGVRTSCDKAANCPDTDDTIADIPLAISLNVDNTVNIVENGTDILATAPDLYLTAQRYRIHIVDHHDGTADISFTLLTSAIPCEPLNPCAEQEIYSLPSGTGPLYPLQVDATFREGPASLKNVTIMRIKP